MTQFRSAILEVGELVDVESDMRRFLYSRWFFLFLAVVCLVDLVADTLAAATDNPILLKLSVVPDFFASGLALWMFLDLHRRRPRKHGDHTGS